MDDREIADADDPYLPAGRTATLDVAWTLARSLAAVWSVEASDVEHARALVERHPGLGARDLLRLACCQRRKATGIKTFDRALAAAWSG